LNLPVHQKAVNFGLEAFAQLPGGSGKLNGHVPGPHSVDDKSVGLQPRFGRFQIRLGWAEGVAELPGVSHL